MASTLQQESNETYGFDAIRGIQAKKEFYVAICPLKIIPKLFVFNDYDLPAKLRAQRKLRESRIPEIKNYILSNPEEYIFSSLTASVDGKMQFIPASHLGPEGKMGRLYINMDSRLLINDGQHRRRAIEEALKENPDLGHESISVVFFRDKGLRTSQQMFSDLNKNAVKPSKSLNILYNRRDPYSQFLTEMIESLEIFKERVELEKTTIAKNAKEIFTLGGLSDATKKMLGKKIIRPSAMQKRLIQDFWECVANNIPEWQLLISKKISPDELRKNYVHGHTSCLNAIGIAGNAIIDEYPDDWKNKIRAFRNIDWSRDNPEWRGRIIQGKHVTRTTTGIALAAVSILKMCNVKIPKHLRDVEN